MCERVSVCIYVNVCVCVCVCVCACVYETASYFKSVQSVVAFYIIFY